MSVLESEFFFSLTFFLSSSSSWPSRPPSTALRRCTSSQPCSLTIRNWILGVDGALTGQLSVWVYDLFSFSRSYRIDERIPNEFHSFHQTHRQFCLLAYFAPCLLKSTFLSSRLWRFCDITFYRHGFLHLIYLSNALILLHPQARRYEYLGSTALRMVCSTSLLTT